VKRRTTWRLAIISAGLLTLVSPFGTWMVARAISYVASGSDLPHIEITSTRGWLLTGPVLEGVSLQSADGRLLATAEEISLHIFSNKLTSSGLTVRINVDEEDAEVAPASQRTVEPLPLYFLPKLSVARGRFEVITPKILVVADGIDLDYAPIDTADHSDPRGRLWLRASSVAVTRQGEQLAEGALVAAAYLTPGAVRLDSLNLKTSLGTTNATLRAIGELQWLAGYPAQISLQLAGTDTAEGIEGELALSLNGDLDPPALELSLSGTASHPGIGDAAVEGHGAIRDGSLALEATLRMAEGAVVIGSSYDVDGDSLHLNARITEGLELATFFTSSRTDLGVTWGSASLSGHPAAGTYAAELEGRITGVAALPGKPVDVDVDAALSADGRIKATFVSQLGSLTGLGRLSFEDGTYDVGFDGSVLTSHLLGFAAPPIAVVGRALPDSVRLKLTTPRLPTESRPFGPVELEVTLAAGQVQAALTLEDDLVAATAAIDLNRGDVETAQVVVSQLALPRLLPNLGGSLSARLQGGGKLGFAGSRASGQIELHDVSYGQWTVGGLTMLLEVEDGALHIDASGNGLMATARLDTASFDGQLRFDRTTLTRRRGEGELDSILFSGEFECSANRGNFETPHAALELRELEGEIDGRPVRSEGIQLATYVDGQLNIERLNIRGPYGNLAASGTASVDSLALSVALDSLSLSAVHDSLDGLVSGRLALHGSSSQPQATARLFGDIGISGRAIGRLGATATLGDSLVAVLSLEQERREGSGDVVRSDTTLTIGVTASRRDLLTAHDDSTTGTATAVLRARELDLSVALSAALSDSIDGLLGFEGTISFPLTQFIEGISLDAFTGVVEVDQLDITGGPIRARLEDSGSFLTFDRQRAVELDGFSIPLELLRRGQDQTEIAGRIDLSGGMDGDGNPDLELRLEEMDLLVIDQFTEDPLDLPDGTVSGSGSIRGGGETRRIDADLLVAFHELGDVHGQLAQSVSSLVAQVEWTTEVADIVTLDLTLPRNRQTERIDWESGEAQLKTEGLNLFVFLERLPQLEEFDGFLAADLSVVGLGANPQIGGQVDIEDLQLSIADVRPRLGFAAARVAFDGARGALEGFTGVPVKGPGEVALSGFVGLDSAATFNYEIRLDVKDLPYVYDDAVSIDDIDAQIVFKSSGPGSLLQGEIQVKGGLAEPPLVDLTAPPVPPRPEAVQTPFLENTQLDLVLTLSDLEIRNELADIDLEGAAKVYGTFYTPRFQGELSIPEGRVIALNREFAFTKGRIVLDQLVPTYSILDLIYDPLLLNPELDLEAMAQVMPIDDDELVEVVMSLKGPALSASPRFSSPGLEDADVITLLAFGSTSTANSDRAHLYEAAAAAAGQLLLSRQVQRLGLDEFQIMPSGTVLGTVGEPSLRMGKFFSFPFPVWVRYEALRREPSFGELQFEYKMTSYLTIDGTAHSELELYGLGIGLKKDY